MLQMTNVCSNIGFQIFITNQQKFPINSSFFWFSYAYSNFHKKRNRGFFMRRPTTLTTDDRPMTTIFVNFELTINIQFIKNKKSMRARDPPILPLVRLLWVNLIRNSFALWCTNTTIHKNKEHTEDYRRFYYIQPLVCLLTETFNGRRRDDIHPISNPCDVVTFTSQRNLCRWSNLGKQRSLPWFNWTRPIR